MRLNILLVCLFAVQTFAAPTKSIEEKFDLFGAKLLIETRDKKLMKEIGNYIKENQKRYQSSLDPDCYYKELGNKQCGSMQPPESTLNLINEISKETKQNFKLEVAVGDKNKRDFGGVAEGLVLDELAQKFPKNWLGNFTGDIFVAPEGQPPGPLFVADGTFPTVPFAKVNMESGWMLGSSSPDVGGKVRDTKNQVNDFERIILFANPEFSGARLNGWSVALIAGGKPLLTHLRSLKEYKGQWSYMYFDSEGEVTCAPDIKCDFKDGKNRTVDVKWSKKRG